MTPGAGPGTASSEIRNPAYLYSVYYMNRMLGMNALLQEEELTIDEYTVTFDSDGGSAVPAQSVYDGDMVVRPANPVKEGI